MSHTTVTMPFCILPDTPQTTESWKILGEGVKLCMLYQDVQSGYQVGIIHYEPGSSVPMHEHVGDEHIYVLSGSQQDERGSYPAGSYVYNPQGSKHSVKSPDGCSALIHWHKPVRFID